MEASELFADIMLFIRTHCYWYLAREQTPDFNQQTPAVVWPVARITNTVLVEMFNHAQSINQPLFGRQ